MAADNRYSRLNATGRAVPIERISNEQIETRCQLEPGWILQRTGVANRPVVNPGQAVSDLAIEAAGLALGRRDSESAFEIGMLILATSTPDFQLPPTAPFVASKLGLGTIPAFDIAVACSGFLYALQLADCYCRVNHQAVLVIAANVLSKRVNADDAASASLFADGAGAVVVEPSSERNLFGFQLEADGTGHDHLVIPDGGSRNPFSSETIENRGHFMKVNNGMAVFRYAVESMARLGEKALRENNMSIDDVDFWIPHQANLRIIESVRQRLNIPKEKVGITIEQYGNSSAATIPLALDLFLEEGKIRAGDTVLMTAAAAGLTSAACLVRI